MKKSDLQELRKGTKIYNDCGSSLEFVKRGIQLYYFIDCDDGTTTALTPNEVMEYEIQDYYKIERIRYDFENHYERYVEEAVAFLNEKLESENLKERFSSISLESYLSDEVEKYLTEKHPEWAEYQIKEVIDEAIYRMEY